VSLALAAEAKVSPHYTTDSLDNINGRIVMTIWKSKALRSFFVRRASWLRYSSLRMAHCRVRVFVRRIADSL